MKPLTSSFRDPHGYLATHQGKLYRIVTQTGQSDFDAFTASGLYQELEAAGQIVSHREVANSIFAEANAYKVLEPQLIPFISYPYEWSFSQFKDAALLTLEIQTKALKRGLSLKDASFFNVQFIGCKPVFIDTLSFEKRQDRPWVAYRQFCQHFLAPLLLMQSIAPDFNRHLTSHIDGFPLPLAAKLLPFKVKMKPAVFMHLTMHAQSQKKHENKRQKGAAKNFGSFTLEKQLALIDHLHSFIRSLELPKQKTEWSDYTSATQHYSDESMLFKREFIEKAAKELGPKLVWDVGGNTGEFSRLAAKSGASVVCFDGDPLCIEKNYLNGKKSGDSQILPLLIDLGNPSPAIGWAHAERMSFKDRGKADLAMALALMHHLRITANIPIELIADFFSALGEKVLIEFVPKDDPMAKLLLEGREDIFSDYTLEAFETAFLERFTLIQKSPIPQSGRILYLFNQK